MAGMELPIRAIREQVSSAVDLVVQQSRLRDGSRKITSVCEVLGMEGDTITTQDIFTFDNEGRRIRTAVSEAVSGLRASGHAVWRRYGETA